MSPARPANVNITTLPYAAAALATEDCVPPVLLLAEAAVTLASTDVVVKAGAEASTVLLVTVAIPVPMRGAPVTDAVLEVAVPRAAAAAVAFLATPSMALISALRPTAPVPVESFEEAMVGCGEAAHMVYTVPLAVALSRPAMRWLAQAQ